MEGNQSQPKAKPSSSSSGIVIPNAQSNTRTHRSSSLTTPGTTKDKEDEESSESESESSPATAELKNFRKQWEAELKHISTTTGAGDNGNGSGTSSGKKKHNTPITKSSNANHPYSSTTSQFFALSPATSSSFAPTPKKESNSQSPLPQTAKDSSADSNNFEEEEAKRLFLMGVSFERRGDLYDAVRYYRRAMQLVPDIEKRVMSQTESEVETPTDSNLHTPGEGSDSDDNNEDDEGPLSVKFLQSIQENGGDLFQKAVNDNKIHLKQFPVELLLYILRWVISDDLDVRTLDILSSVSKGFYCLCRDEQLWKLACDRVWNASSLDDSRFLSYRDMFLSRPRVRYDGCYISRVTYVRPGEHSFQDQSYRPWHMVEYFRYIRFFPDGKIYFLTTAERPAVTVASLRDRDSRNPATLRGTYRLYGNNLISATVIKSSPPSQIQQGHSSRKYRSQPNDITTFHMDFEIEELKQKNNWVLRWTYYAVYINNSNTRANNRNNNNININNNNNSGAGITSTFELSPNKYPPLYFSRVKSYTSRSENILE